MIVYNTLHKKKEQLIPIKEGEIGMYSCGPTVYNYAHIGNLRTYVFMDILRRALIHEGFRVKSVMNITDVGHLVSDADAGEECGAEGGVAGGGDGGGGLEEVAEDAAPEGASGAAADEENIHKSLRFLS